MAKSPQTKIIETETKCNKSIGGRTTISPPAKICPEDQNTSRVLASNIDTLKLSLNIKWNDGYFFAALEEAKSLAQKGKSDYPLSFVIDEKEFQEYFFNIKPHGTQGYEWILTRQLNIRLLCSISNFWMFEVL